MDKFDSFIRFGDQAINLNWVVRFVVTDDGSKVTAILKDTPPDIEHPFVEGEEAERILKALQWDEDAAPSISNYSAFATVPGPLSLMTVAVDMNEDPSGMAEIGRQD